MSGPPPCRLQAKAPGRGPPDGRTGMPEAAARGAGGADRKAAGNG